MRRYETVLIAHVDLPDDELNGLVDRCSAIITDHKGILVKVERWGKRRLAYLIKKQARGFYILFDYAGTSAAVNELERNLKINDKILKFMTILKEDAVDPAAVEKEIAENSQKAQAPEAAKAPSAETPQTAATAESPASTSQETPQEASNETAPAAKEDH